MNKFQDCTIKIIYMGTALFSAVVTAAALLLLIPAETADVLLRENLVDTLMTAALKTATATMLTAFISDFLVGRKEDGKN